MGSVVDLLQLFSLCARSYLCVVVLLSKRFAGLPLRGVLLLLVRCPGYASFSCRVSSASNLSLRSANLLT